MSLHLSQYSIAFCLISIIPLTCLITGTSIGNTATIVPLTLSSVPFIAQMVEATPLEVPTGLIETAQAMGKKHNKS